jgi:threonine/homoserine efflux transporter RhtA
VVGPAAVLLSQNTLQRGRSAAAALTIVLVLDPLVGVATGVLWLGEQLTASPAGMLSAVACAAAAVAGAALAPTTDRRALPRPRSGRQDPRLRVDRPKVDAS